MQELKVSFEPNAARGCSEYFYKNVRVVATILRPIQSADFEIEVCHKGAWSTVYYERLSLDGIKGISGKALLKRTIEDVAAKKIRELEHLIFDEAPRAWDSGVVGEPLE